MFSKICSGDSQDEDQESVVSKVCSQETEDAEEQEESTENVEILDMRELAREIDAMHDELDQIQKGLHVRVPRCPAPQHKTCQNEQWVQLYGSKQPDIRNLQLQTKRLEYQVDELKKCSQIAKLRIGGLKKRHDAQRGCLSDLQDTYNWIHSQCLQMEHNYGKCLQRYRHNRTIFATWTEVHQGADELKSVYKKFLDQMYDRPTYIIQRKLILREINLVNSRCVGAIQVSLMRAKELDQRWHFPRSLSHPYQRPQQQILKDATKRRKRQPTKEDFPKISREVTLNYESKEAFDWDLQSRQERLQHGSVSEIETVEPPALRWYGRVQKLMALNRKPSSLFEKLSPTAR